MIYVTVGSLVLAALASLWAVTFYYKLWQWGRQCQHARIVVSQKGRVRINAPLVEWLLWANMLDKDKDANGRIIYSVGGTQVAILKRGEYVARGPAREFAGWAVTRAAKLSRLLHVTSETPKEGAK